MTGTRAAVAAALVVVAGLLGWLFFAGLPRWYAEPAPVTPPTPAPSAPADAGRTIKARLYFLNEDGTRLQAVEREVPYAGQTVDQARRILEAQLSPAEPPLTSALPPGTTLRAVFLTGEGTAFVDLSREVTSAHHGGALGEILTVYTIVEVLTTNLPAITSVQVLVDGKEVDTLAGHLDLKRPLRRDDAWVAENISR